MKEEIIKKHSFSVIGKLGQGQSSIGYQWVPALWGDANHHFEEIQPLVKLETSGEIEGLWGIMSDIDENFSPWKEEGKYLAGCEVKEDAVPPEGWTKWMVPSYEYLVIRCNQSEQSKAFQETINVTLPTNKMELVGAVHERFFPKTAGEMALYFPIKRL